MKDTTLSLAQDQPRKTSVTIMIPASCAPYKNDIRRFADAMVYKLSTNAHKGRWENLTMTNMQAALSIEVKELNDAIEEGNTIEIMLEAADVANFALIISSMKVDGKDD